MRAPVRFLILAAGLTTLGLGARPALAADFNGTWIADIPIQGKCNIPGMMTLLVAGHSLVGEVHRTIGGNPNTAHIAGTVDEDGSATFVVGNSAPGAMKFDADHFDGTWNNGYCDRHVQGDRAPDDQRQAALTVERKQHQAAYADLVQRANAGDKAVDYTALRAESVYAADWDFYDGKVNGLLDQASAAAKGKDCAVALQRLDQAIKLDFTIDSAHALKSDCLKQIGEADKARIEFDIADGLVHSLMDSAAHGNHGVMHALANDDGQSEQSAYVVGTLREEMDVLANRHIQIKVRQTEVRGSDGRFYDLIKGVSIRNEGGTVDVSAKDVYFDITNYMTGRVSRRAVTATALAAIR